MTTPVSDQKERSEGMSGKEAQKSKAEQALEKAVTAISAAREASLQTLLTIQTFKDCLEGRGGETCEEDYRGLTVTISDQVIKQCEAFEEAGHALRDHYFHKHESADTVPPLEGSDEDNAGMGYCSYCGEYHHNPYSEEEAAALNALAATPQFCEEEHGLRKRDNQSLARHSN